MTSDVAQIRQADFRRAVAGVKVIVTVLNNDDSDPYQIHCITKALLVPSIGVTIGLSTRQPYNGSLEKALF